MSERSRAGLAVRGCWSAVGLAAGAALVGASLAGAGPDPAPVGPAPTGGTVRNGAFVLSQKALLGRRLFFDATLSVPAGQSCASCHAPEAGFTFPDSAVNARFGTAPGAVAGRFGFRAVPTISYAAMLPEGPPRRTRLSDALVGGLFWDGRADTLAEQALEPFVNPNEMNNLTHNLADPGLVVQKVAAGANADLFRRVFGARAFEQPTGVVYGQVAEAIAEYEKSSEVSPFSSKYDAWKMGKAEFNEDEMLGLRLVTGSWSGRPGGGQFPREARCVGCHVIPQRPTAGPDLWTVSPLQNIGVPRNPGNPFYLQTDSVGNPAGYNGLGSDFVDYGLGHARYRELGLPPGNQGAGSNGLGDFLGLNGLFKAPTLRNVDKRPSPGFVKAYFHNGVFKSLERVVHFYNTRNLTTAPGEVIDFTREDPYEGLFGTPLWDPPENPSPDLMINPEGLPGDVPGTGPGGESEAEVGNLRLTMHEEKAIVAFLRTLSDGWFDAAQVGGCLPIVSQPVGQRVAYHASALITAAARSSSPVRYQWRRDGVPLPGETTSFVTLTFAAPSDAGWYDCVITSACGSVVTRGAEVLVCIADFDQDGKVDELDREAYLAAYVAGELDADRDGDGAVDPGDLEAFLGAYEGGC